jgi:hypothetical protein
LIRGIAMRIIREAYKTDILEKHIEAEQIIDWWGGMKKTDERGSTHLFATVGTV